MGFIESNSCFTRRDASGQLFPMDFFGGRIYEVDHLRCDVCGVLTDGRLQYGRERHEGGG